MILPIVAALLEAAHAAITVLRRHIQMAQLAQMDPWERWAVTDGRAVLQSFNNNESGVI